jgi:hypothetical protein
VAEISQRRGPARTLRDLVTLLELGLVRLETPPDGPAPRASEPDGLAARLEARAT